MILLFLCDYLRGPREVTDAAFHEVNMRPVPDISLCPDRVSPGGAQAGSGARRSSPLPGVP
jgi:hypothetical protein